MTSEIIVAIVSLLGTALGSYSGFRVMSYRVKQLEIKVEKHNNFAQRMPVVEEKLKVADHRISDLEEAIKK